MTTRMEPCVVSRSGLARLGGMLPGRGEEFAMTRSGSRAGWAIVIPALLLGTLGGWQQHARPARQVRIGGLIGGQRWRRRRPEREACGKGRAPGDRRTDGRCSVSARCAARPRSWRKSAAPRRLVVDQVCLVSDLATFLEAIAAWDERHYFPILIDEPAWTLPVPASVSAGAGGEVRGKEASARIDIRMRRAPGAPARGDAAWLKAIEAVRRACSTPPEPDAATKGAAGSAGPAPQTPGLVLADPESDDHRGRRGAGGGPLSAARAPGGFSSATRCSGCGRKHPAVR